MSKIHERFEMLRDPNKPRSILMPIEWVASIIPLLLARQKVRKHNMKGLKGPFLIFSNHAAMIDFQVAVKATFPHKSQWVISIEEFVGREWLMRGIGGIPKRKFTTGPTLIKQIMRCIRVNKKNVVIYPEARYSLAGITEDMSGAMGKLAKLAGVPVIVINQKGHFIHQPQWNKKPVRSLKCVADVTCVATAEETKTLSAEELQKRIVDAMQYDDFKYVLDNKIKVRCKKRAERIHKILYKCPHCGKEYMMDSKGIKLWCNNCGAEWEMNEYCQLHCTNKEEKFTHVPDWYRWERQCVIDEVENGTYVFEDDVRIEELISGKIGFIKTGTIKMRQDNEGIHLHGKLDNGQEFNLEKPAETTASIHIEYNFKKRGDAIDINTLDATWFVYPLHYDNVLTKIHFATEAIYQKALRDKGLIDKH